MESAQAFADLEFVSKAAWKQLIQELQVQDNAAWRGQPRSFCFCHTPWRGHCNNIHFVRMQEIRMKLGCELFVHRMVI